MSNDGTLDDDEAPADAAYYSFDDVATLKQAMDSLTEPIYSSSDFFNISNRSNEAISSTAEYLTPSSLDFSVSDKIIVTGDNVTENDISDNNKCINLNYGDFGDNDVPQVFFTSKNTNYSDFFLSCAQASYLNNKDNFGIQWDDDEKHYNCYIGNNWDKIAETIEEKTVKVAGGKEGFDIVIDLRTRMGSIFRNLVNKRLNTALNEGYVIEEFVFENDYCGAYIKTNEDASAEEQEFERECYYYIMTYDFMKKLDNLKDGQVFSMKLPKDVLNINSSNVNALKDPELYKYLKGGCYYVNTSYEVNGTGEFPWSGWKENENLANDYADLAQLEEPLNYIKIKSNVIKSDNLSLIDANNTWSGANIDDCEIKNPDDSNFRFLMHHNDTCYGTNNPSKLLSLNAFTIRSQKKSDWRAGIGLLKLPDGKKKRMGPETVEKSRKKWIDKTYKVCTKWQKRKKRKRRRRRRKKCVPGYEKEVVRRQQDGWETYTKEITIEEYSSSYGHFVYLDGSKKKLKKVIEEDYEDDLNTENENNYNLYFKPIILEDSGYSKAYEIRNLNGGTINQIVTLNFTKAEALDVDNNKIDIDFNNINDVSFNEGDKIKNVGIRDFYTNMNLQNTRTGDYFTFSTSNFGSWEWFTLTFEDVYPGDPGGTSTFNTDSINDDDCFNNTNYRYDKCNKKFESSEGNVDLYLNNKNTNAFLEARLSYDDKKDTIENDIEINKSTMKDWQRTNNSDNFVLLCNEPGYSYLREYDKTKYLPKKRYIDKYGKVSNRKLDLNTSRSPLCINNFKTTIKGNKVVFEILFKNKKTNTEEKFAIGEYISGYTNDDIFLRKHDSYKINDNNTENIILNKDNNWTHHIPSDNDKLKESYMLKLDLKDDKPNGVIRVIKNVAKQCYKSTAPGFNGYGVKFNQPNVENTQYDENGDFDLLENLGEYGRLNTNIVHNYSVTRPPYDKANDKTGTHRTIDKITNDIYTYYASNATDNSDFHPDDYEDPGEATIDKYYISYVNHKLNIDVNADVNTDVNTDLNTGVNIDGQLYDIKDATPATGSTKFPISFKEVNEFDISDPSYNLNYTRSNNFMKLYQDGKVQPPLFVLSKQSKTETDQDYTRWFVSTTSAYQYFEDDTDPYKSAVQFANNNKRLDGLWNLYVIKNNYIPRVRIADENGGPRTAIPISQYTYDEMKEGYANINDGYANINDGYANINDGYNNINRYKETFKMNNINKSPLFNDEGITLKEGMMCNNISDEFKELYNYDFKQCNDDCSNLDTDTKRYCDTIQNLSKIYHLEKDISDNNATIDRLTDYDKYNYTLYLEEKNTQKVTLEAQAEDSVINNKSSNLEIIAISIVGILAIGLVYTISKKI